MTRGHRPSFTQRVAAVVALAALFGALVLLFVGWIGNLGPLVLLLIGLCIATLGAWDSLTRTGAFRFGAVLVVLAGLGLLAGGFTWADLSLVRATAVLALGLVSVGSGRVALGKEKG